MAQQKYNPLLKKGFQEITPPGAGGSDLQATLMAGNSTGGMDIFVTLGDSINFNSIFRFQSTATGVELQGFVFGSWQKIGDIDNNILSLSSIVIENALFEGQINPTNLTANRFYQLPDSDGTFALDFIQSGQTTDGVQLTLPSSKVVANNTVQSFVIRVSAIQSATAGAGTVGDVWVHEFRGAIKQIAGVTTIVDTVTDELIAEDVATAGFSVLVEAGTGTIDVKVTGELNKTIEWKAVSLFNEVVI